MLGVPIRQDTYVKHILDCRAKYASHFEVYIFSKLDYPLRIVYPSQIKKAAKKIDRVILGILEKLLSSNFPM